MKKIIIISFLIISTSAEAYIGLGPLIPIIGSSIAFLWGLIIIVIGLFSYPLIKFYKFIKNKKKSSSDFENKNEIKDK
tara:strand:+ start:408 stop:641 length:234 start_codon:yes stop_codon:yes gene_type:complete